MILDPEKAKERLESPNNLANKLAEFRKQRQINVENNTVLINPGRKLPRLPEIVKEEIKEKALSGMYTQREIGEKYGVSPNAVGVIKREAEYERERAKASEREDFLEKAIKDLAAQKMLIAMGLITEEKLESLKARELAQISASLSSVVGVVSPKNQTGANINLVVYSPEVRSESSYRVVEIKDSSSL